MLYEHELVRKGFARWYNGRLIPVMRGGDQRADAMFPELPTDLTALDDDALQALHDEFQTAGRALLAAARSRDAEVLGERTQDDVDAELTTAAEALAKIRAEQDSRKADEESFEETLTSHEQTFGTDTSDDTDESDDGDTDTDETAETETADETEEAATASAKQRVSRPIPLAARRHRAEPPDVDASGFRSQIRSEAVQLSYGDQLDREKMGVLLNHVVKRNVVSPGGSMVVASATVPFDEEMTLSKDLPTSTLRIRRIQEILASPEGFTASGALCAMLEPRYDIFGVSVADRPVRAALPSVMADRGGVVVRAAIDMTDYEDAVGVITADENFDGSTNVKNCMRLICPEPTPIEVASIYRCIEADNLAAKSDPELMAAVDEKVRAEHARLAETFLLDGIKDGSTAVTGDSAGDGGAVFNLLGDILKGAAGYRSRHRMSPNATLTALIPAWVRDLLALDVGRAAGYQRTLTRAEVDGFLRAQGIMPSYYLDSSSTASPGQIFGAQSAGAILDFPTTVEWFLFAPGTWLHLDSGTLDLGVVRDSILNSTNDFQIFAEGWENVAKVGNDSLAITSAVCPSGTFSAGIDNKSVC